MVQDRSRTQIDSSNHQNISIEKYIKQDLIFNIHMGGGGTGSGIGGGGAGSGAEGQGSGNTNRNSTNPFVAKVNN